MHKISNTKAPRITQAFFKMSLTLLIFGPVVAVIVIIVAGFMYTVSQDDPSQVSRAKNTLLGAIVGLAVVLLAFVITNTVLNGVF